MEKLGTCWDPESAERFYKAFCKFGKQWAMVATRVPGRSPGMVQAMYRANRTYLGLPESARSAIGFRALVQDMFARSAEGEGSSDESLPAGIRSSGSKSKRGARRTGSSAKQGKSKLEENKGRKRKRELFPEPVVAEPVHVRRRKTHTTAVDSKKSGATTGLDSLLAVMSEGPGHTQGRIKLKTKFKGKEEPKPPAPCVKKGAAELWLQNADALDEETKIALVRLHHSLSSRRARRWSGFEWFYGAVDRLYFAQNEFQMLLASIGIGHVTQLTRTEWSHIRGRLGRPRRLSSRYLSQERAKLAHYRAEVRNQHAGRPGATKSNPEFFLDEIPAPINVGQRVLARHPDSGEMYLGSILLKDNFTYRVQFDNIGLGVAKIQDCNIMPHPYGPPAKWTRRASAGVEQCNGRAEQLQRLLRGLGVELGQPLPTIPPNCHEPVSGAISALDMYQHLSQEIAGLPENARDKKTAEVDKAEQAMAAAVERLAPLVAPGNEAMLPPPELLVEKSIQAASKIVTQLWPAAGLALQGQGADQAQNGADTQRLQQLVATGVATVLAVHDSAAYQNASKVQVTLAALMKRLRPLGKGAALDQQEMLHSVNSFVEAVGLLS